MSFKKFEYLAHLKKIFRNLDNSLSQTKPHPQDFISCFVTNTSGYNWPLCPNAVAVNH